jgi:3-deoxy-7-phosphoheptulonate synthase
MHYSLSTDMQPTRDLNIVRTVELTSPQDLLAELPCSESANQTVVDGRAAICRLLRGEDPRLLAVVGPCSIHDEQGAMEYAHRLVELSRQVADRIVLVMRVYFEKPRTTLGWKGLINDPHLNGTFDIAAGLRSARRILLAINELGMPAATEMLEPITPQYVADLVTWAAIGARTTESQTHRQMASGLSMPVGFKNGTDGGLQIAIDAMLAAQSPHSFLGIDPNGRTCIVQTKGNPWGHLILRGGRGGPNYAPQYLAEAYESLQKNKLCSQIMVDCSHANSEKDHRRQEIVWNDVIEQRVAGNRHILGMMVESNLHEGAQKLGDDPSKLQYGVSITDACTGWDSTREMILRAHDALA